MLNCYNDIIKNIDMVMDFIAKRYVACIVPIQRLIEQTIEIFSDDASKDLYCREIVFCILKHFLGGNLASEYSGIMAQVEWDAYMAKMLTSNVHPELIAPSRDTFVLNWCKTTTFVIEEYAYKDKVRIKPGDICLDFGACLGETSIWMVENGASEIYAFEIDRENIAIMRQNIEANHMQAKINIVNKAVSNKNGSIYYIPATSIGSGKVKAQKPVDGQYYEVDYVTIDEFCRSTGIKPTFIKMDIEGAEMDAIKGGENTFRKLRPAFAICIYHAWEHRWQMPALLHDLCPNYSFYLKKSHPACETVFFGVPAERFAETCAERPL